LTVPRILVVDDDPAGLELTRLVLSQAGYRVDPVETGEDALRALAETDYDLVLLDVVLPGISGHEVLARLRADPATESLPVVLMSARFTASEDLASGLDAGADGYIARPVSPPELLARVRAMLRQSELTERLRANERRLRELLRGQVDAVVVVDQAGLIRFVNPAAESLFGRSEAELLGAAFGSPIGAGTSAELQIHRPDQVGSIAEMRVGEMEWEGEPAWIATLRDVTASREAEARLAEQAALIDHASDAILVLDLDHRVLFWNRAAEALYGWTAAEVQGQPSVPLLYPDRRQFSEAAGELRARGEWAGELRQQTRSGGTVLVYGRWQVMRGADGKPTSILALHTDITERKRMEEQLLRAQRLESIGTLAGGIAHDLNNVLAPILMSIDFLRTGEEDPARLETLDAIEESAMRGAEMVRQVLSFARGVEGRRQVVDVGRLVESVGRMARDTFLKHIAVAVEVPADVWPVRGDATQLHQVLVNLCVNARDAMPHGGALTISADNVTLDATFFAHANVSHEARPGSHVRFEVRDTGVGMSESVLANIFEPFFTTKEIGQGTGLGLPTAHAIIASHEGFIHVDTELGRGSSFAVYLPAAAGARADPHLEPGAELSRGHGELILVVDDEPAVRRITQHTLEAYGYHVILASDGAEAVARFVEQREAIALVVTDVMMPVMDGAAMAQVLRRIRPDVPILASSGLGERGLLAQAGAGLVTGFLPKPYTAETLLRAVRAALEPAAS